MLTELSIFPITPGQKGPPTIKDWPNRAKPGYPIPAGHNYGVHCVDLCVVDVDPKNGGDASFKMLELFDGFPPTFTVGTPSGGRHLYYRMPAGTQARNSAGDLGEGIDTRGRNGYVVGPGSKTDAGEYTVLHDLPIADAPRWLAVRITAPERQKAEHAPVPMASSDTVERAREWLSKRPKGDNRYVTACGLRDIGVSAEQAVALLMEHCPADSQSVVQGKVENAYAYAQNEAASAIAKTEDFDVVEEAPVVVPTAAAPQSGRLLDFAREPQSSAGYLIKGMLSRSSYAMIYGEPGAGKTFVGLDIAYHVAAGREWNGRRVKRGAALYLAYEGVGGMRKRAQALVQHYGPEDVPLYIWPASYDIRTGEGRRALAKDIAALPEVPSLIVFDTFAHALMGGDENSAQDVGAFNTGVAALVKATGACVMILHHPRKAGDSARGSGALLGAVDTEIRVGDKQIKATKQRDVELAPAIGFALMPITVGVDEDGDVITSCVVVPAAVPAADGSAARSLHGKYKLAWAVLCDKRPDNKPISEEEWRQACVEFLNPRRRQDWPDIKLKLRRERLIEETDGMFTRRLE